MAISSGTIPKQVALLLMIACVPALLAGLFHPKRPRAVVKPPPHANGGGFMLPPVTFAIAERSLEEIASEQGKQKILWVDARERADYDKAHIPGALLLNEGEWSTLLTPLLRVWTRDRTVVVYNSTQAGNSAGRDVATRLQDQKSSEQIYVLKGGWEAWTNNQK